MADLGHDLRSNSPHVSSQFIILYTIYHQHCQNGVPKFYIAFILMCQIRLGTATWISRMKTCWPTALIWNTGSFYAHWKLLKARRVDTSSKLSPEFEKRESTLANNWPRNVREESKSYLLGQVADNSPCKVTTSGTYRKNLLKYPRKLPDSHPWYTLV